MFLFLIKFMIFLLNHDGFLSSQVMVSWRMKFESTLLMVLLRNGHFPINVLSMKSSFPVLIHESLAESDQYSLFYNARFHVHRGMGSKFLG